MEVFSTRVPLLCDFCHFCVYTSSILLQGSFRHICSEHTTQLPGMFLSSFLDSSAYLNAYLNYKTRCSQSQCPPTPECRAPDPMGMNGVSTLWELVASGLLLSPSHINQLAVWELNPSQGMTKLESADCFIYIP